MLWSRTNVEVRRARSSDAAELAEVHRASWFGAYRGIISDPALNLIVARRNEAWWSRAAASRDALLVLDVGGVVAGYATCGDSRRTDLAQGEIFELYLKPEHQGQGLGEFLFEGCRHRLDRRRLDGLVVWVLAANEIAVSFYWARGGRIAARTTERVGTGKLDKVAFVWP